MRHDVAKNIARRLSTKSQYAGNDPFLIDQAFADKLQFPVPEDGDNLIRTYKGKRVIPWDATPAGMDRFGQLVYQFRLCEDDVLTPGQQRARETASPLCQCAVCVANREDDRDPDPASGLMDPIIDAMLKGVSLRPGAINVFDALTGEPASLAPEPPADRIGDAAARKAAPVTTGLLDYFPDACIAVAALSKAANDQHNPGQPMHWAKEKSTDHADCLTRHLIDRGTLDNDGQRHSAKVAWRALALLQTEIEAERGGS